MPTDAGFLARQRARADAEFYTANRLAEANKVSPPGAPIREHTPRGPPSESTPQGPPSESTPPGAPVREHTPGAPVREHTPGAPH